MIEHVEVQLFCHFIGLNTPYLHQLEQSGQRQNFLLLTKAVIFRRIQILRILAPLAQ